MDKEFQKRILSSIIILPLTLFFIIEGSVLFTLFLISLFLISSFEWLKMSKKNLLKIFGIFFLIFSFYSTFYLRDKDLQFFLLIVIICISTDLGGYIFGKLLKGPKLIKISPNKTYSGMIGGFFLTVVNSYIFIKYFNFNSFYEKINLTDFTFILIVLVVSSVSQIGDLIISYFKRYSNIKNTGNILPGHGGLLDRIDGMIFVFPFVYLTIKHIL